MVSISPVTLGHKQHLNGEEKAERENQICPGADSKVSGWSGPVSEGQKIGPHRGTH